jgi:ATP-dependent DNA ligase
MAMSILMPEPMEAKLVSELPVDGDWQFEPKWDGFRAIVRRQGDAIDILSKSGKDLARYFPEIVALVASTTETRFVVDGELVVPAGDVLSFDALQARLHPAESRVMRLSRETPAQLILFDCLHIGAVSLTDAPLSKRRERLEAFHAKNGSSSLLLSPCSADRSEAEAWLKIAGGALDGVVAKARDEPYRSGERAMLKVKQRRTADCVVGGFRRAKDGRGVGSLLLGLYDDEGKLDHVGFTSGIADDERAELAARLERLIAKPGFTGKAPGGPSRWSDGKASEWEPLKAELVVEVRYDQVTANRFRHGTRLLRWRPDKAPQQCRMDQLARELRPSELDTIIG